MTFNLATVLRESREAFAPAPMCHTATETFSYADIDRLSGRLADGLRQHGLQPGDKVALQLPNMAEFIVAYFGALKAGLVVVPLNPLLRTGELEYHLRDCNAKLLITSAISLDQAAPAAAASAVDLYLVGMPNGTHSPFAGLYAAEDSGYIEATSPEDTAVLLYTSGTTGKPKGAELTHFQLYMNCSVTSELFALRQQDTLLAVLPLFHVFGLSTILNGAVRRGASLALLPKFDPAQVLNTIETRRCTVFAGVPTMYGALLHVDGPTRDLGSLRLCVSGASALPTELLHAFEEKFPGVVILEGYGLSETASATTFNRSAEQRKILSIGTPIWGVDVQVIGDDGAQLPSGPDHVGEIVVRGHNVMKGYYQRPDETAKVLADGWLRTGDLAYRDTDGYLFIVDRAKDLIIRGGYNVYPREVEEVLYGHPAVAETAVVGRPDERLGEEVIAIVSPKPGATVTPDELIAYCRDRLAPYKYPREIRIVDTLPTGPTGKILKREIRQSLVS